MDERSISEPYYQHLVNRLGHERRFGLFMSTTTIIFLSLFFIANDRVRSLEGQVEKLNKPYSNCPHFKPESAVLPLTADELLAKVQLKEIIERIPNSEGCNNIKTIEYFQQMFSERVRDRAALELQK